MTKDRKGPERVGGLVDAFLDRKGLKDQVRRQEALVDWDERVGERIAAVTSPRAIAEGTLFVEVRSSAWLMELNMMKSRLLDRVNAGREGAPIERLVLVLAEDGREDRTGRMPGRRAGPTTPEGDE